MSDAINRALAAAEEIAEQTPDTAEQTPDTAASVPSTQTHTGGAVAQPASAPNRSLAHLLETASMNVEAFLRVSELGIQIGKDKQLHDELFVEMNLEHSKAGWVIRVNTGGAGVKYLTSYDGVMEHKSRQNWSTVVAEAQKIDGNAYISDLLELPVKLLHDAKLKEPAGKVMPAGTILGLSLSYKGLQAFMGFLTPVAKQHGTSTPLTLKLTAVSKVGSGQEYGVFGFEIVDPSAVPGAKKKAA